MHQKKILRSGAILRATLILTLLLHLVAEWPISILKVIEYTEHYEKKDLRVVQKHTEGGGGFRPFGPCLNIGKFICWIASFTDILKYILPIVFKTLTF